MLLTICGEMANKQNKSTQVFKKEDILACIEDLVTNLDKISSNVSNSSSAFCIQGSTRISQSSFLPLIQYRPQSRLENTIKQIIMEFVMKSEGISPHASAIMLKSLKYFFQRKSITPAQAKNITEEKIDSLSSIMKKPTTKDLKRYLKKNFTPTEVDLAFSALKLAGPIGKITFEYSNVDSFLIDASTQNRFKILPDTNILLQQGGRWERENVACFSIESFIEKVSEIDCILSLAASKKIPVLINCLGYSHEVVSTVLLNNRRGTLDVMLVCPTQEDYAINDLMDLAVCMGGNFYGYQTGTVSTHFDEEHFNNLVQKITVDEIQIFVKNESSKNHVKKRIEKIKKDLGESEEKDAYLMQRITNLESHRVKIILPETNQQNKHSQIENIDHALRAARSIVRHGIVNWKDKTLQIEKSLFCGSSVYTGLTLGYELFKHLYNIDAAVTY